MAIDNNPLFWATGVDNSQLNKDVSSAIEIFKKLSSSCNNELSKIEKAYDKVLKKSNVKFGNPVEAGMYEEIRRQIAGLGTVIDTEVNKLANLSYRYDKSMQNIKNSASKITSVPSSDPLAPIVNNIHKGVKKADDDISYLQRIFKRGISYMAVYGSVDVMKNFLSQVIEVKGQFDILHASITSFVPELSKANRLFNKMTSFAVKSPFQLMDITKSAKQLLSVGEASNKVIHDLQMLSDIASGSGQRLDDLSYIYTTSITRGRVYQRELYQYATRGIPIYQSLSEVMGVSTEKLMQMVKAGKVGFPQLNEALENMVSAGGRFYGLSDKIAATTYGRLSNLKDKWMVALSEIGEDSEGIMNSGIELTTSLIEHWKAVENAIEAIIVSYGTMKAAQGLIWAGNAMNTNAYNMGYSSAAPSDVKEILLKQGLTVGSREYAEALREEMEARLANSNAAIASIEKEIIINKEFIAEREILIADSKRVIASKESEMEAAIANGYAVEASSAKTAIDTASKELNTFENEKNTAQKNLNTASTALNSAQAERSAAITAMDTMAKEGNAAATGLLTTMTNNLKKAWQSLTLWISTNPWTAAAAAVSILAFAIYKLYQYEKDASDGEKRWNDEMKKSDEETEKRKKSVSDLVNIIKQETTSNYEREMSLQKLQNLMPTVFKNMTTQQMLQKSGYYWQQKVNEEAEKEGRIRVRVAASNAAVDLAQAKQDLERARSRASLLKNAGSIVGGTIGGAIGTVAGKAAGSLAYNLFLDKAEKEYNDAKIFFDKAQQAVRDQDLAMRKAALEPVIKDKDYWEKKAADLNLQRSQMEVSQLNSPAGKKLLAEENYADEQVAKYGKASTIVKRGETETEKAKRLQEQKNRLESETNERKLQIDSNTNEIIQYEAVAEEERQKAYTTSMQEGYLKDKQVIEDEYNKKKDDIEKQKEKILKLAQQNERLEFKNANPKNESVFVPTIKTYEDVPEKYKKGINDATEAANMLRQSKEKMLKINLLKEYDDYTYQKLEIDRKYYADRSALEDMQKEYKQGTLEYDEITTRLAQNEKKRVAAQANLTFKETKESPIYQQAYGDLSKVSIEGLNRLLPMLKQNKKIAQEAMNPQDIKTYSEEIDKVYAELAKKDPFSQIIIKKEELKRANEDLLASEKELKKAQDEYNDALSNYNASGKKNTVESVDKNGKVRTSTITVHDETSTNNLTKATKNLTDAQNKYAISSTNVKTVQKELRDATDEASDAFKKVGSALTDVGDSIGHTLGATISAIGDITSFVGTAIDGISTVVESGVSAMEVVQSAVAILAIISAAIKVIQKIASLFSKESNYEKMEKQLSSLNKTLETSISLYEKLLKTVSGSEALAAGAAQIAAINAEIENNRQLAAAKMGDSSNKIIGGHHSMNYNYRGSAELAQFNSLLLSKFGVTIKEIGDLSTLTSDQLKYLEENAATAWAGLGETVTGYLNEIIEKSDSLKDTWNEIWGAATGVDWDSIKNGLDDLLMSANTTMSDVYTNFESYMRNAILNLVKTNYLSDALEGWYKEFANDMSDNVISTDETEKLKTEYETIYQNAQKRIDDLLEMADIGKTDSSSNSIKSSFQSMSEDQANVLEAQFSAIRLNVSDIKVSLYSEINKLDLMANDISEIRKNTAYLVSIKSTIDDIYTRGVIAR